MSESPFTLYYHWLSPACRFVMAVMAEYGIPYQKVLEKTWERRKKFYQINPAGTVPVLVSAKGDVFVEWYAIIEALHDTPQAGSLLPLSVRDKAEVRRLIFWFMTSCDREVTDYLLQEKVFKRFLRDNTPNASALRAGLTNLRTHLGYIDFLMERRHWLAGDQLSLADFAAGAHVSCMDYLGHVPWQDFNDAKDWYTRLKSRPSFRCILEDVVPSVPPVPSFAALDF
jgi:glutathione S-transferase